MATDDPEGWDFFHKTFRHADGDPDIKILNNLNNVGAIEVNAFQSQADVCMQKSIREGFGLTVTEAQWKGRPVGGDVEAASAADRRRRLRLSRQLPHMAAERTVEIPLRSPAPPVSPLAWLRLLVLLSAQLPQSHIFSFVHLLDKLFGRRKGRLSWGLSLPAFAAGAAV